MDKIYQSIINRIQKISWYTDHSELVSLYEMSLNKDSLLEIVTAQVKNLYLQESMEYGNYVLETYYGIIWEAITKNSNNPELLAVADDCLKFSYYCEKEMVTYAEISSLVEKYKNPH